MVFIHTEVDSAVKKDKLEALVGKREQGGHIVASEVAPQAQVSQGLSYPREANEEQGRRQTSGK